MNLIISNIAWAPEHDEEMFLFLSQNGFDGLEVAPSRIFPDFPYDHAREMKAYASRLKDAYGLAIRSMQSIWFGRTENIFDGAPQRKTLISYTQKAMDFAMAAGCENLVFGCPKNRAIPSEDHLPVARAFFRDLGECARQRGLIISLEPNPPIYSTNFINTTPEAFSFCEEIASQGLKVNIDAGTMIYYREDTRVVQDNIGLVGHIHISEPNLAPLEERPLHRALRALKAYNLFYSIEMRNPGDIGQVKKAAAYGMGVFH